MCLLKVVDKKGNIICKRTIGNKTGYVDRLNSFLYAKAEWRENTFVIFEQWTVNLTQNTVSAKIGVVFFYGFWTP